MSVPSCQHVTVAGERGHFAGWPANNGVWDWDGGHEILVGYAYGGYRVQPGHNITEPISCRLARSLDGGLTWRVEEPTPFVGRCGAATEPPNGFDLSHPDLALRIIGAGYHGSDDGRGAFLVSLDRGHTWNGPYSFGALNQHPELERLELTPRTDYVLGGPREALLMLSGRTKGRGGADRAFCAQTSDGGVSFQFLSWITPRSDPYRAVMPTTVRCPSGRLVTAIRRRELRGERCWVDAYASCDDGATWAFLSLVGDTGGDNGNPPALARLHDGRMCCVYGNRTQRRVLLRYSADEGATWGAEHVLREGYGSAEPDQDFGYPRLVQRADGVLVAMYYWATPVFPWQHIAATLWEPDRALPA